uniref:Uncharacterized protein n=1 Tax=Arundo donax TaxID=35708 RepID=A0A0A9AYN0_ARUDO
MMTSYRAAAAWSCASLTSSLFGVLTGENTAKRERSGRLSGLESR